MADIHKPLTIAAVSVMVVGIGYTLADAWFFFLADPTVPPAAAELPLERSINDADVPVAEIAAMHLFGRPRARPGGGSEAAATENLRETRLSLDLVGVFVADEPDESRALIAQKGRDPESYAPGDRLPGNARLVDVYWNRVVISRDGEHELLRFDHGQAGITRNTPPRQTAARTAQPRAAPARAVVESARPQPAPPVQQALTRYREEFAESPERLLAEVGVGLAEGDGYVVGALADRPELSHAGLQPGDRILTVNGHPVGDPRADRLRLEDFIADGAARLEIQRGERRFLVTVAVN